MLYQVSYAFICACTGRLTGHDRKEVRAASADEAAQQVRAPYDCTPA
jgi:hypothetical protein